MIIASDIGLHIRSFARCGSQRSSGNIHRHALHEAVQVMKLVEIIRGIAADAVGYGTSSRCRAAGQSRAPCEGCG
jgi:hypothetical protein